LQLVFFILWNLFIQREFAQCPIVIDWEVLRSLCLRD